MRSFVFFCGLAAGALGFPRIPRGHVRHQTRVDDHHSHLWTKKQAPDSTFEIPIRIALAQQNLEKGMDLVMAV